MGNGVNDRTSEFRDMTLDLCQIVNVDGRFEDLPLPVHEKRLRGPVCVGNAPGAVTEDVSESSGFFEINDQIVKVSDGSAGVALYRFLIA